MLCCILLLHTVVAHIGNNVFCHIPESVRSTHFTMLISNESNQLDAVNSSSLAIKRSVHYLYYQRLGVLVRNLLHYVLYDMAYRNILETYGSIKRLLIPLFISFYT